MISHLAAVLFALSWSPVNATRYEFRSADSGGGWVPRGSVSLACPDAHDAQERA